MPVLAVLRTGFSGARLYLLLECMVPRTRGEYAVDFSIAAPDESTSGLKQDGDGAPFIFTLDSLDGSLTVCSLPYPPQYTEETGQRGRNDQHNEILSRTCESPPQHSSRASGTGRFSTKVESGDRFLFHATVDHKDRSLRGADARDFQLTSTSAAPLQLPSNAPSPGFGCPTARQMVGMSHSLLPAV